MAQEPKNIEMASSSITAVFPPANSHQDAPLDFFNILGRCNGEWIQFDADRVVVSRVSRFAFLSAVEGVSASVATFVQRLAGQPLAVVADGQKVEHLDPLLHVQRARRALLPIRSGSGVGIVFHHGHNAQLIHFKVRHGSSKSLQK